ncbi:hypothetical protein AC579_5262, partial [Pseudocercospora musae]
MEGGDISALNDDFIGSEVPKNLICPSDDTDHEFLMHVRLAQLCSRMLGRLYSKAACNTAHDALAEEVRLMIAATIEWIEDARAMQPKEKSVPSCPTTWTWYLLLLYIFNRSLALPSDSIARQKVELAVSTHTSEILESLLYQDPQTVRRRPTFLRTATTAFCVSACLFGVYADTTSQFRQLGFALGFFARLNQNEKVSWDELSAV